jgi:hypothetical protein
MASASSLSTYLDISQAAGASRTVETPERALGQEATSRAANIIAAIYAGTELAKELPAKTDLTMDQVLATLAWLSGKGLVELDEGDGSLRARLTEPVKKALSSAS